MKKAKGKTQGTLRSTPPSPWRKCAYPSCDHKFRPKRRRSKQKFCSTVCRVADWNRLHPRVDLVTT